MSLVVVDNSCHCDKPQGSFQMSKTSQNRERGKEAEKKVRELLQEGGFVAERVGLLGQEDVVAFFEDLVFRVEVKTRKKIAALEWFKQVERASSKKGGIPIVMMREYGKQTWYVLLRFDTFKELIHRIRNK